MLGKYFKLTKEEAEILYKYGDKKECPLKYHTNERRIWWVFEKYLNSESPVPYSFCDECYYNNKFGTYGSDVKSTLVPILTDQMPCNCDASSHASSYPVQLSDGWKVGIYTKTPKVKLLNTNLNDDIIKVEPISKNFEFAIKFNKRIDALSDKIIVAKIYVLDNDEKELLNKYVVKQRFNKVNNSNYYDCDFAIQNYHMELSKSIIDGKPILKTINLAYHENNSQKIIDQVNYVNKLLVELHELNTSDEIGEVILSVIVDFSKDSFDDEQQQFVLKI